MTTERLEIGRIGRPHGVRGDVMVTLTTNLEARVSVGTTWWVGDREMTVESSRPHQGRHIVHLSGLDDRDAAAALTGARVFAPRLDDAPDGEVWVRVRARGASVDEAADAIAAVEPRLVAALGADCYGRDTESLEQVVGRLLIARRLTVSVAESCTGGLLGHRLTAVAGSSAYFDRGVVVYSNRAKEEMLGVPAEILTTRGAVSAECAEAMVRGICEHSGSACGLSVTGIAGPEGGSPAKPVGTVFIGVAVPGEVASRRFRFEGDRASVKWQSSQMALDMLRRRLGGTAP